MALPLCPAPSSPPHETLFPTQSPFTHQLMGALSLLLSFVFPLPYPGGASQRCLAGLGGLGTHCFKSIFLLSGEKKNNLQVGLQADQAEGTRQEGSFSRWRCAPGLRGGKRLLWLESMKSLLAGALNRGKKVDSELAKWDFSHLPRLAANWAGSYKGVANQQGKRKVLHCSPCLGALVCSIWGS